MHIRGIRGATVVESNTKDAILNETKVLLQRILEDNKIETDSIATIFFSVTNDLNAAFPATAAREMGFTHTPMLCFNEIDVPGSLRQCIRILVQVNSEKSQREMKSIYLKEATVLRPDHANNISTINQAT